MDAYTNEKQAIVKAIKSLEKKEIKESSSPIDFGYLKGLNEAQKIASTRMEGNYLVIAGPGAGKTHTLLYRVVHMINMGVSAQEICIVTFTRKAANQLKERIKRVLPEVELGFIGTIHSLAYTLINRSLKSGTRLIDPEDDKLVLKLAITEHSLNLPSRTRVSTVLKVIDYSAVTMKSIEESLVDLNKEDISPKTMQDIFSAYKKYKEINGYVNYSDVIALASGADRGYLNYLMIDEYQDTDPLQLHMIKMLNFPNVMAIGDDFQSIYSFRGADNKIILNFGEHFSKAKVIKLNINYRSTSEIVAAENVVSDATDYGYKKKLISNRGISKLPVQFPDIDNGVEDYIFRKIIEFRKNCEKGSVAVMYRYNRRRTSIEALLIKNKIDYVVYGGFRLLERKHIKDIFAILLVNKNKNDFIPYLRALTLLDGIGEVSAKKLINNEMNSSRKEVQQLRKILFVDYSDISSLLRDSEKFYLSLESVLIKSNYPREEIEEDFRLINDLAKNYQSIPNFISDIILDSNTDKWSSRERKARVVLTTIHSAKGLEFDQVHFLYDPSFEYTVDKAEENRRLFYTAISRAKNGLYIYDLWRRKTINEVIRDFETESMSFNQVSELVPEEKVSMQTENSVTMNENCKTKIASEEVGKKMSSGVFGNFKNKLASFFKK